MNKKEGELYYFTVTDEVTSQVEADVDFIVPLVDTFSSVLQGYTDPKGVCNKIAEILSISPDDVLKLETYSRNPDILVISLREGLEIEDSDILTKK